MRCDFQWKFQWVTATKFVRGATNLNFEGKEIKMATWCMHNNRNKKPDLWNIRVICFPFDYLHKSTRNAPTILSLPSCFNNKMTKAKEVFHYSDVIMGTMAPQIISLMIVYSIVYSGADQIKLQSSASLAIGREIHRWPVNSPRIWPVTRKMFPFDNVIMQGIYFNSSCVSITPNHEEVLNKHGYL